MSCPLPRKPASQPSKSPAAIRMRRLRERRASRVTVIPPQEIGAEAVKSLCDLGWLAPNEAQDPEAIGDGVMDLAETAIAACATRPRKGEKFLAFTLGRAAIQALVKYRWLSASPGRQRPDDIADALVDAADAAIGKGLAGKK